MEGIFEETLGLWSMRWDPIDSEGAAVMTPPFTVQVVTSGPLADTLSSRFGDRQSNGVVLVKSQPFQARLYMILSRRRPIVRHSREWQTARRRKCPPRQGRKGN